MMASAEDRAADAERVPLTSAGEPQKTGASLLLSHPPAFASTESGHLYLLSAACAAEATCYTLCVPFLTTHLQKAHGISLGDAGMIFIAYTIGSVCATPFAEPTARALGTAGAIAGGIGVLGVSQLVCAHADRAPSRGIAPSLDQSTDTHTPLRALVRARS